MTCTRTSFVASLALALLTAVGVMCVNSSAQPPAAPPGGTQNVITPASRSVPVMQPPTEPGAQLLADARSSFTRVKDYMGTLVKEERVGGTLMPEQFISMRVRQQPFSVYLKWTGPKQFEGQEASYVTGKNGNKMKAKGTGVAAVMGFVSLDVNDPRALKENRHAITELGIGHLIDTLSRGYEAERALPPAQVQRVYRDYMFQQKQCSGMETIHRANNGQFYCYRTVVYFDKTTKLPVRFEAYDWPTTGGAGGGEKLECYSYVDLKFNVALTDAAFGQ
jgi:Protein of unknown function (DUF1571)